MLGGSYNQYLWYFGSRIGGCPWAGVAQLGTAAGPTRAQLLQRQRGVRGAGAGARAQLRHGPLLEPALHCAAGAAASMIVGAEEGECTHSEYGNPFDPMGGGGSGSQQMLNRCYHMNGVQKAYQDWLGGCNIVKATTSGRFTIYPLEKACNGVQLLQVPLPAARTLRFPALAGGHPAQRGSSPPTTSSCARRWAWTPGCRRRACSSWRPATCARRGCAATPTG